MLYPMFLLDTKNKEWRGKLSGAPQDISDFFENQYSKFIGHYTSIAKQTKVEGFIIGSEFAQLTRVKDVEGNYPAVAELVKVAKASKASAWKEVNVTYAADWSEYHSYDGWYNMDELWVFRVYRCCWHRCLFSTHRWRRTSFWLFRGRCSGWLEQWGRV
nr:glycoside hydrolase TIM-barrel-like domain-containing protein [Wolbachia endosymbiont of Diaphorina citri]